MQIKYTTDTNKPKEEQIEFLLRMVKSGKAYLLINNIEQEKIITDLLYKEGYAYFETKHNSKSVFIGNKRNSFIMLLRKGKTEDGYPTVSGWTMHPFECSAENTEKYGEFLVFSKILIDNIEIFKNIKI